MEEDVTFGEKKNKKSNRTFDLFEYLDVGSGIKQKAANTPQLASWNVRDDLEKEGALIAEFVYTFQGNKSDKVTPKSYVFQIETNLAEINHSSIKLEGNDIPRHQFSSTKGCNLSILEKFPFYSCDYGAGFFGGLGLAGIVFPKILDNSKSTENNNTLFEIGGAAILAASIVYLGGRMLFSARLKLIKLFDSIESNLLEIETDNTSTAINRKKLSSSYVSFRLFFNNDLNVRYYYLMGLINQKEEDFHTARNFYLKALPFVTDKKMLVLKNLVNVCGELEKITDFSYENEISHYLHKAQKLPNYKDTAFLLKKEFNTVIKALKNKKLEHAFMAFKEIFWDTYCNKAYPHLGVIYHSLDAAFALIMPKEKHITTPLGNKSKKQME